MWTLLDETKEDPSTGWSSENEGLAAGNKHSLLLDANPVRSPPPPSSHPVILWPRVVSVAPISSSRIAGCPAGESACCHWSTRVAVFSEIIASLARVPAAIQPSGTHKLASVCPPTMSMHKALFHGHGTNTVSEARSRPHWHTALTHTRLSGALVVCRRHQSSNATGSADIFRKKHTHVRSHRTHTVFVPCCYGHQTFPCLSAVKGPLLHQGSPPSLSTISSFRHRRQRSSRWGERTGSLDFGPHVLYTDDHRAGTGNTNRDDQVEQPLCTWNVLRGLYYMYMTYRYFSRGFVANVREREQRKNGNAGYRAA